MIRPAGGNHGPVVGVAGNRLVDDAVHRDWLRRRYLDALERHADVATVILPTSGADTGEHLASLCRLDGLVLTGDESDLDPAVFRRAPEEGPDYTRNRRDRYRDRLSAAALRTALALDMPILGICRGLQELNVHLGGTLHSTLRARPGGLEHAEDTSLPRDDQYEPVHAVELAEGGVLHRLFGASSIRVNSLHNQGIDGLGHGLAVEAVAPDGLIEAVRVEGSPALQLAVQWHPEWHAQKDPASQALFHAFGQACQAFRTVRRHR